MNSPHSLETARAAFLAGNTAFEAGDLSAALSCYQQALAAAPGRVSVLVNLGVTRLLLGDPKSAVDCLLPAVAAEPLNAPAWHHLGAPRMAMGDHAGAKMAWERAIDLAPALAASQIRLAQLLMDEADWAAAERRLAPLARQQGGGKAWVLLARCHERQGHLDAAIAAYQAALRDDSTLAVAQAELGAILKDRGDLTAAGEHLRAAVAGGDNRPVTRFLAASLGVLPAPTNPPRDYVQTLFDGYASGFDTHLEQLHYQAPTHLLALLLRADPHCRYARALDLGCGTGLMGAAIRARCEQLCGVDLAPKWCDRRMRAAATTR